MSTEWLPEEALKPLRDSFDEAVKLLAQESPEREPYKNQGGGQREECLQFEGTWRKSSIYYSILAITSTFESFLRRRTD